MLTVPVFTLAELTGEAHEKALRWAFEHFSCPDYALECEKDTLTCALDAFGFRDVNVWYRVCYSKSDYCKIDFKTFRYEKGGLQHVKDNLPCMLEDFKLVYNAAKDAFFAPYYDNYQHFEDFNGTIKDGIYFYNAVKNLEKRFYYFLRDSLDYYFSDDFIQSEIGNYCPLFTSEGNFVMYGDT